jgi:DNA-directed RNA polymerase specialized sigma24 family protein
VDEIDYLDSLGLLSEDPWPDVDKRIDIEIALAKMEPKQRDTMILWSHGYTYKEIATRLDISSRTAKRYVKDGKTFLSLFS